MLLPGRRLSRSTVSTAAPSEACSGSSARTPGTSPSVGTQEKKKKGPVSSARCGPHLPGRQRSPPAVLSPWCPHPLQEAEAHPLRRFQATLQVLEEDPEWGEEISSRDGLSWTRSGRVRARVCVGVLPAVKLVNLGHVSKQDILLAAQSGREEVECGRVLHLRPVALGEEERRESGGRTGEGTEETFQ